MTLRTSKHRKRICTYLSHIQKDYIINIYHVRLSRNLYVHYVRLSTSKTFSLQICCVLVLAEVLRNDSIPTVSNHSRMPQICWKGCTFDENHSLIERGFVPRGAVNVWICGTLSVGICETVSWHLAAGVLTQKVNRDSASRWQGAEVRSQLLKPYLRPNPPSSYPPMISSNSSLWAGHTREKNEEVEILFGAQIIFGA